VAIACYAVPGLGATGEIFQKLTFPEEIRLEAIEWVDERKGETLADYAKRLLPQIDTSAPFFIAGFSFGAAVAVELSRLTDPLLTVIVSGVASRSEIPFYLKRARAFHLYKLAPIVDVMWTPFVRWNTGLAFGTRDKDALDLLTPMIQRTDPSFYVWGLEAMMDWDNDEAPEKLFHIHGSRDRLLPLCYVEPDMIIKGGGHFIVYTHGEAIAARIAEEVLKQTNNKVLQPQPLP